MEDDDDVFAFNDSGDDSGSDFSGPVYPRGKTPKSKSKSKSKSVSTPKARTPKV